MELKQRKRVINNLPKFNTGDNQNIVNYTSTNFLLQRMSDPFDKMSPLYVKDPGKIAPVQVPVQTQKKSTSLNDAAPAMITQGVQFAGDVIKAFGPVKSEGELLSDSGTGQGSVMGVGYETQNSIDTGAQMDQLRAENTSNVMGTVSSGAALGGTVGSVIPGVGTAIGTVGGAIIGGIAGIFGSSRRKRKLKQKMIQANLLAQRTNMFNRTSAMSGAMEQNWALEHSNTQDDILYANRGKDLKQPKYNRL